MKTFITDDFLLKNDAARELYHKYAEKLPIIDYHSHLDSNILSKNERFKSITEIWLSGDHYKWRAMRANGISENLITGNASDEEKFQAWAQTVPYTMRNPLYHWTHLELLRYFGIDELLTPDNAKKIYEKINNQLKNNDEFLPREILKKMNVEVLCTTDDPINNLNAHLKLKEENYSVKVLPTWRPDKLLNVNNPKEFNAYVDNLSKISGKSISTISDLLTVLSDRQNYFVSAGCKLADFGLDVFYHSDYSQEEVNSYFQRLRNGEKLDGWDSWRLRAEILYQLSLQVYNKEWTQQFHVGPIRNNNSRAAAEIGADTGYDSIGSHSHASFANQFLNRLAETGQLAKSILYNSNPADNEVFATLIGNFQDGKLPGKIQWGSAWWFLDQKDGIQKQLNCLSNHGLISRFVGMLTDSRSFLSFPRHEYFRRILCNLFGEDIENGELPNDIEFIGKIISDICYYNAKNYFKF